MDVQEVIDLKKQLEEDFRKDTEAVDRVLALLEKRNAKGQSAQGAFDTATLPENSVSENNSSNSIQEEAYQPSASKIDFIADSPEGNDNAAISLNNGDGGNGNKNGNKFGRVRDTGVKGIAKQAVQFLPQDFQRKDLVATMAEHFPEWADKLTKDAINGALSRLLEDGLIELKEKARGKFPATYTKL